MNSSENTSIDTDFPGDIVFIGDLGDDPEPAARAHYWYWFVVNVVFMAPTIFGNSLILISLFRFKHLRKTKAYILIGNLAVSDLLVGLVVMPMDLAVLTKDGLSKSVTFCTIHLSLVHTLIALSVLNLFLLSLERFSAIVWPFKHARRFTKNRIYFAIAVTWTTVGITGTIPLYYIEEEDTKTFECRMRDVFTKVYREIFHSMVLASLVLCTIFFLIIVRIATRAMNRFRLSEQSVDHRRIRKDIRHTRNMLIITGLFIIFWSPYCIVSLVPDPSETLILIKIWLSSFGIINSCLNWVVYGARCTKFRAAFASILNCKCAHREYKLPATSS